MLASNLTGVAVLWVKWYQCMVVHFQLNGRHHIQIFNVVLLPITWSLISDQQALQPQVIPYSRVQYFSTFFLKLRDFPKKVFWSQYVCVCWFSLKTFYEIFPITIKVDRTSMKNIRKSSCQRAIFYVRFTRNLNFSDRCSKNIQIWSVVQYRQIWASCSMCTDGQTDMTKLLVAFRNLMHLIRNNFLSIFAKHRMCQ